jgi:hypothetical protein
VRLHFSESESALFRPSIFGNGVRGRGCATGIDERTQWVQRIQATLDHHSVSDTPDKLRTRAGGCSSTDCSDRDRF